MSVTRHREFAERVQNQGELGLLDELLADDMVDHTPAPGLSPDKDGAKAIIGAIRAGFPDHDCQVIHMIGEGDMVATYKTFTGTHENEFLGIPPTGRRATIRVMDFVRYRDGQVVDHWNIVDVAGLMAQLTP